MGSGTCVVARQTKRPSPASSEERRLVGDVARRQNPEIASVETDGDRHVHQDDFVGGDAAAAVPDGQRMNALVAVERIAENDGVDDHGATGAADILSPQRGDMFQQRYAAAAEFLAGRAGSVGALLFERARSEDEEFSGFLGA